MEGTSGSVVAVTACLLLMLLSAVRAQKFNDDHYSGDGCGKSDCANPTTLKCKQKWDYICKEKASGNTANQGRWVTPPFSGCPSTKVAAPSSFTGDSFCLGMETTRPDCCDACQKAGSSCKFWQHMIWKTQNSARLGVCWLYGSRQPACPTATVGSGSSKRLAANISVITPKCTCSATFNDNQYPDVDEDKNDCGGIRCQECTEANLGYAGRYDLPQGSRCNNQGYGGNSANPYCHNPSVHAKGCCTACSANPRCKYWQHYVPASSSATCSGEACGICWLYYDKAKPSTYKGPQVCFRDAVNASRIGMGKCTTGQNDPHFVGAHGAEFEFNGIPDQSFCLLTNRKFQVNMKMRGYYDDRTVRATVLKNGKAIRSWIKELGFVWKSKSGREHTFRIVARDGKSQTRDDGFLSLMEFDGQALPALEVGDSYNLKGGLRFTFAGYEKQGNGFFDVDAYNLKIRNYINLDLKLRIAHPLLQTPDDAQTHINVHFNHVSFGKHIHGVVGQTYREGREKRAMEYSALSELLGTPIAADGENGKGFLDGNVKDYRTSSVLATDCVYTAYGDHELPEVDDGASVDFGSV